MAGEGKCYRYVYYFLACSTSLLLSYGYLLYAEPGFIGGSIRPYEYAMEAFYKATVAPGIILAGYFMVLAGRTRQHRTTKALVFSVMALFYLALAVVLADQFYYSHLGHGQGG